MAGDDAIPEDARQRLDAEFAGETYYEAVRQIEVLALPPRVQRSLIHLAGGDLDALRRNARVAEQDPERVNFWAENDDHDASEPRKVRSMEEPFPGR
jgi:hypothetical protein